MFALSVESAFASTGKACALTCGRSDVLRIVGREFAPAGDLLLCFAKEEGKKGDPATPVIRYANDSPALLPAGGRRGTRPSGSDSRAGLPRPLLRCSAAQTGFHTHRAFTDAGMGNGPLITCISFPLWRADWRVRQAEKGLRMFEPAGRVCADPA